MKNRLLYLAVVGLTGLVNLSCAKDDPPVLNQISVNFSKKALEYVQLTEGTRLLYRDSATSIVDTVIVTKSSLQKTLYPERTYSSFFGPSMAPAQNADNFNLILTTIMSGTPQASWFEGEASAFNDYLAISIDDADMFLNEYFIDSKGFENNQTAFVFYESATNDILNAITLEGTTYQNVVVYDNGWGGDINDSNYRKSTYYWAKGVGIIKRTIITTGGLVKTSTLVSSN